MPKTQQIFGMSRLPVQSLDAAAGAGYYIVYTQTVQRTTQRRPDMHTEGIKFVDRAHAGIEGMEPQQDTIRYVMVVVYLLLDGTLLDSDEPGSLLLHAGSATFAGRLYSEISFVKTTKKGRKRGTYLVLDTAGLHLVGEDLGAALLGFRLVDVLHENALVLEHVTLGFLVERVVPAAP
jgi:hypothetical protein